MIDLSRLKLRLGVSGRVPVSGVPQGFDAMLLPETVRNYLAGLHLVCALVRLK